MSLPKKPSKRELKKMEVEAHNKAYLESKKPKPEKPMSKKAKARARQRMVTMTALMGAFYQPSYTLTNEDRQV